MEVTRDELIQAFTAWDRDWLADPDGFWSERDALDTDVDEYGGAAADCLIDYLDRLPGR